MPQFQTLVLFLGAALALDLTPGPDMLYVAARGSGEGRTSGTLVNLAVFAGLGLRLAVAGRR